jgi:hypothetical protein
MPSQALQIILEMQSQKNTQKRAIKKIFLKLQNAFFSFFFILTPPSSSVHNFLNQVI